MLESLLEWGYDASLPVDEFLCMEFRTCCYVCGQDIIPGQMVLIIPRWERQEAERALGPLLHRQHVVLVDLFE